ncbi:MAG: hypothetical protein WD010_07865 [Nitriliruptor sp.]|uniref:hypothetical protein n=1 Tax=Nitriliruptor sp. TaxID=2448056 RepID=UPI0034A0A787
MRLPEEAIKLCEAQRGVLARHQLRRWLPQHVIDDLLRNGHLERLEHGVTRIPGSAPLPEQAAFAAALRARPLATVTGPLVLHLFQVPSFIGSEAFEILLRPHRRICGVEFPCRRDPDPGRAVAVHGEVRTTGPLDALIDAAGDASERDLRLALDHLRHRNLVTLDRLRRRVEQLRGLTPGAERLEEVLDRAGGAEIESEGERMLAPILAGFEPRFEPQVWVTPRRRVDFYSRRCRYGYEYLGEVDHAYVAARLEDDARDTELREEGIRLGYVTKHDLREPVALVATMAGTLTVRAHELGVLPPVAVRPLATTASST